MLKKRSIAWCVLVAVVLLTLSLSGGGALRSRRTQILNVFYLGVNGDGLSIENDLKVRVQAAERLSTIGAAFDAERAQALKDSAKRLSESTGIGDKYRANEQLTKDFEALYDVLGESSLSAADKREADNQNAEFEARADTISRDAYNDKANQFNKERGAFPTGFIALIGGVPAMELFS